jgi:hypothetical protein
MGDRHPAALRVRRDAKRFFDGREVVCCGVADARFEPSTSVVLGIK